MNPRLLSAGPAALVLVTTAILQNLAHAVDADAPAARVSHLTADVLVSADATFVETTHAELLATNAAAALQTGQFRAFYDADLQTLDIVNAHTLKKDGRTIAVDPSAIYDQLAPGAEQMPLFSELRMKTIVFPQFEAGDTAVYALRMTHKEPYFRGAFWYFRPVPHVRRLR